jgi:hypothetical protein
MAMRQHAIKAAPMEFLPESLPPHAPSLPFRGLSEQEERAARALEDNLADMERAAIDLAGAVSLYEFSTQHDQRPELRASRLLSSWSFMGARYGAMALRNFREALGTVRSLIGQCPSFLPDVDTKALRAVEKEFDDAFPRVEKLRHSVAHPEFYSDPDKKMNADGGETVGGVGGGFAIEYGGITRVGGDIVFGTYVATIDGIAVKYPVNADTVRLVSALTARAFEAFKGVQKPREPQQSG